jgi:predicted amidophosphoribosyltransferase
MEWSCKKINNEIEVYYGPFLKGRYKLLEEPFCHVCAHSGVTNDQCTWHHSIYGLERIYAMGKYVPYPISAKEDLLSYHIWGFKKYQSRAYPLGKGLEVTVQALYRELLESTIMVPIPLHPDKLKERGYNQSFELANVVGGSLNIAVKEMLFKTRNVDMRALNWEERRDAVNGLYALQNNAGDEICNQKILLVDDVVTTGFTVSECAQVLKDAGAASVNVLAAGRTVI